MRDVHEEKWKNYSLPKIKNKNVEIESVMQKSKNGSKHEKNE